MPFSRILMGATAIAVLLFSSAHAQDELSNSKYPLEGDKATATKITGSSLSQTTLNNEATEKWLKEKIDLSFDELLFFEVNEFFRDQGINLILDRSAIDDSLTEDEPLTMLMDQVPAKTGLKLMLDSVNATYMLRDGVIVIISKDVADDPEFFRRKVFDLRELLAKMRADNPGENAIQAILDSIVISIAPDSWAETNGDGAVTIAAGLLVVFQTQETLSEVEDFLKDFAFKVMNDH